LQLRWHFGPGNGSDGHDRRLSLAVGGLYNQPDHLCACQELGKAWSPRYKGKWSKEDGRPFNWCTEFACWAIRKGGGLAPDRDDYNTDNLWGEQMVPFYAKYHKYLCAGDIEKTRPNNVVRTSWDVLPHQLISGSYIKMYLCGHSGIFVSWHSMKRNIRVMNTIEGNSNERVSIATQKIYKDNPGDDAAIVWSADSRYLDEKQYYDGFGVAL
jgi:hypothetical protein